MNVKESFNEEIKATDYQSLKDKIKNHAQYWNGIWNAYLNIGPNWTPSKVAGNKGQKIPMNQEIPLDNRVSKNLTYKETQIMYKDLDKAMSDKLSAQSGYNNYFVGDELTTGNIQTKVSHKLYTENQIRDRVRALNKRLVPSGINDVFKLTDYSYNTTYDKKELKSYKVNYVSYGKNLDVESSEEYWTKDEQSFNTEKKVTLYKDKDVTTEYKKVKVHEFKHGDDYVNKRVEWTGDRYYITKPVSIVTGNDEKVNGHWLNVTFNTNYSNPTNMTSNSSKGVIVSCNAQNEIYKLFKDDAQVISFSRRPSVSNPIYINFRLNNPFILTRYELRADNRKSGWESPCEWKLQASNDNSNWTTLKTYSNEESKWGQNLRRSFDVSFNKKAYFYYRLYITEARKTNGSVMELGGMRFFGKTYDSISVSEPQKIGKLINTDDTPSGTTDFPKYNDYDQEYVYVYMDETDKWYRIENEDYIKKHEYDQLNKILDSIGNCLKKKDGWFKDSRCNINCQVKCQNSCQVSCQLCNTKQCHDQKCGTH